MQLEAPDEKHGRGLGRVSKQARSDPATREASSFRIWDISRNIKETTDDGMSEPEGYCASHGAVDRAVVVMVVRGRHGFSGETSKRQALWTCARMIDHQKV